VSIFVFSFAKSLIFSTLSILKTELIEEYKKKKTYRYIAINDR